MRDWPGDGGEVGWRRSRFNNKDECEPRLSQNPEHIMQKGSAIIVSTFALLIIVLAVANLPDITRYVKISRM